MTTKKIVFQVVGLTLALCLLTGCGSPAPAPTTIPAANPSPTGTGTITGRVHLVAPPTPRMVVYAVNPTTGAWAFAETQATDSEAPFSITVPPGTYQVFAAVASDSSIGVGYTLDHATLATVTIAANQTVADIIVRPPGESACGATMGYPASPDGRFTGRPGPTAECIATIQADTDNIARAGTIMGNVHLMAPPVPSMMVYAVNQATGEWASARTEASNSGVAPFSIVVPPGTYVVYGQGVGYSLDSLTLTPITVAASQTVTDINVGPPSQFECGSMMGFPAAPDGSFAAIPGPDANCVATSQASGNGSTLPQTNRIQFQPNATSWQISESIAPNSTKGFVLYAMKGQKMSINLTTEPAASAAPYVVFSLSADVILTFAPVTTWSSELSVSQDYYITVMSMSQQTVNYTLSVEILP